MNPGLAVGQFNQPRFHREFVTRKQLIASRQTASLTDACLAFNVNDAGNGRLVRRSPRHKNTPIINIAAIALQTSHGAGTTTLRRSG